MTDTIKDKIRKLLALAEGKANEHESARAMEIASALMMRYGIERESLKTKFEILEGESVEVHSRWYQVAALACGMLYGCSPVGDYRWERFRFVGRAENVDAAEQTFAFVILQIERLYKLSLPKGLTQRDRAEYRRTFKQACATRVYERVAAIVSKQVDPNAYEKTGTALAVIDHRRQLRDEVKGYLTEQGVKSKNLNMKFPPSRGAVAGYMAGDKVDLNKQVQS